MRRLQEVREWRRASAPRSFMLTLVYAGVTVAIGVLLYLCLLYGVKFERRQTESWIVGTLVGFVTDALVQQPLVELIKVCVALVIMLCRSSLRGAVLNHLAAKRDELKLALAQARDLEAAAATGATVAATAAPVGGGPAGSPPPPTMPLPPVTPKAGGAGGEVRGAEVAVGVAAQPRPVGVLDVLQLWPGRRARA
jgi:hypothetical protein